MVTGYLKRRKTKIKKRKTCKTLRKQANNPKVPIGIRKWAKKQVAVRC